MLTSCLSQSSVVSKRETKFKTDLFNQLKCVVGGKIDGCRHMLTGLRPFNFNVGAFKINFKVFLNAQFSRLTCKWAHKGKTYVFVCFMYMSVKHVFTSSGSQIVRKSVTQLEFLPRKINENSRGKALCEPTFSAKRLLSIRSIRPIVWHNNGIMKFPVIVVGSQTYENTLLNRV